MSDSQIFNAIDDVLSFFNYVLICFCEFIFEHRIVLLIFLSTILFSCVCVVIDFVFDIRDEFKGFHKFQDYISYSINYRYKKNKNKNTFDFSEYYGNQIKLADYKHSLKMKELNKFSDNYDKLHKDKTSYQMTSSYRKQALSSQPKYNKQHPYKNSSYENNRRKQNKKYRDNLDIEFDENLAP